MVNICNGMPTSLNKQHIVGLMLAGRLISRWAFDQQEESFSNKEKKNLLLHVLHDSVCHSNIALFPKTSTLAW